MADHHYLNGQHLACEVLAGMREVLTKSGFSFMVKMIREIISMPRADSGYPIILWSIPGFSRMTSPNLMPKPTADISVSALGWISALSMESTCTESVLGTLCQHLKTKSRTCVYIQSSAIVHRKVGNKSLILQLPIDKNCISIVSHRG